MTCDVTSAGDSDCGAIYADLPGPNLATTLFEVAATWTYYGETRRVDVGIESHEGKRRLS